MAGVGKASQERTVAAWVGEALFFATVARWRQWLRGNHGRDAGAWVLIAKKGTPRGIAYAEALEEALCWGWIDGKVHRRDERYFAQWFCPRRPRSVWSLANRRTVERLLVEGRMQPAGLALVAEAKKCGRWASAYASATPPRMTADVRRALQLANAWTAWQATSPSRKLQLLYWIGDAKRPETRTRRLAQLPTLVRERRLPGFGPT
jgi:uncharacterized protein YdeI (YjbR/CyaY-like superfamily)